MISDPFTAYLLIVALMAVESSFIPFPSEIVVPPAAYFAVAQGHINIYVVVALATMGALIGALVNYYLAVWLGRPIVYRFANSRFGHICLIDEAKVANAEAYFDKHGAVSTFVGRLIPAVRQLISIPAGLAGMNIGNSLCSQPSERGRGTRCLQLSGHGSLRLLRLPTCWRRLSTTIPTSHTAAMRCLR